MKISTKTSPKSTCLAILGMLASASIIGLIAKRALTSEPKGALPQLPRAILHKAAKNMLAHLNNAPSSSEEHHLTQEELFAFMFFVFDSDNSGTLDYNEIIAGFKKLLENEPHSSTGTGEDAPPTEAEFAEAIKGFDHDHDGKLNLQEWIAFMKAISGPEPSA